MALLQKLKTGFINFLYPSFCLHCKDKILDSQVFCKSCSELLCLVEPLLNVKHFAAFEMLGPAYSLFKALKKNNFTNLSKGAAGFLIAQFINLKWPLPNVVIPSRGNYLNKDHVYLLAKETAKILDVPFAQKKKKNETGLVICDILNKKVITDFSNQESYILGLCFDVSFDHLNFLA
ncbi:MAG: hypothetical protein HZB76_03965 [Chlamydiae bacterium]|nr:hypothetical protein [Chlamydiota bacterium]